MSEELKPCPFCGGKGCQESYEENGWIIFYVECESCGASTSSGSEFDEAIEKWNTRYDIPKD